VNLYIGLHLPVNVDIGQFIIHFKYHTTVVTSTVSPAARHILNFGMEKIACRYGKYLPK